MRLETSNKDSNKMNDDMQASLSEDDSSLVSMDDFSDSSGSGKHSSVAEVKKTPDIADAETRAVRVSKILMIIGLITTAVAVSVVIYLNSHDQEDDDFHNALNNFADEIFDLSESKFASKLSALKSLSIAATSHAITTGVVWPNFTLPDFERRSQEAISTSGAELIAYAPFITTDERSAWEQYSVENQGWLIEGLAYRNKTVDPGPIPEKVYNKTFDDGSNTEPPPGFHTPLWQVSPAPTDSEIINKDLFTFSFIREYIFKVFDARRSVLSESLSLAFLFRHSVEGDSEVDARSLILEPVFETFEENADIKGFMIMILPWKKYFDNVLANSVKPLLVEVSDTCGSEFTYLINGRQAYWQGNALLHDPRFDDFRKHKEFASDSRFKGAFSQSCDYKIEVYPTKEFESSYKTNAPLVFTLTVGASFLVSIIAFIIYDWLVARRQRRVMVSAERTAAIVSHMFPKNIANRMLEDDAMNIDRDGHKEVTASGGNKDRPIADLFPEVTILFADLVGFTAWASAREPVQVFRLLEAVFSAFDEIAGRRRIFKVETVGDCYVAASGLPDPRKDHAVAMARFAKDALVKLYALTNELEVELGPDTTDLGMRFGMHSGPVTAGVLRGERARFQLFGDTMNTASRIETTGQRGKIHISQETADLLIAAGKGHWVIPRADKVWAKGKGEMQTFWINVKGEAGVSTTSASSENESTGPSPVDNKDGLPIPETPKDISRSAAAEQRLQDKQERLVGWNTEILARLLRDIVARRHNIGLKVGDEDKMHQVERHYVEQKTIAMDEVKEVVHLPRYCGSVLKNEISSQNIDLGDVVMEQLRVFVHTIAAMYRDNPFHNFEHASHVTMSVVKLLSRIVVPPRRKEDDEGKVHDNTYGITSDPLTQFAVIFSALIHDVDHQGVPNTTLVKEGANIASVYRERSIAEQNSIDLAWDLLMDDQFNDLRRIIYTTEGEFRRFRQLVVNTVMATDIMDKDLKTLRNARWEKAFTENAVDDEHSADRKATIVIEHLIQASDVAHTMQHWHIYRKWNQRLFEELYKAFEEGRADKNPADFWYEGEMGFFDFYILPLAKKLKDCGVFGVSSDEYLNYAKQNRREWEMRGKDVVEEMVAALAYNKGASYAPTTIADPELHDGGKARSA